MSENREKELSFDEFDEILNPGPDVTEFEKVVNRVIGRRGFLKGTIAFGTAAFISGSAASGRAGNIARGRLGFEAVASNTLDTVTLPEGYKWHVVIRWGDPLWSNGASFDQVTRGTGASQELASGDNNDGMVFFQDSGKNILAINNEYTNRSIAYGNRESKSPETDDDFRKGKAAHGITVMEIQQREGQWIVVKDSPFNRRITSDTPMELTGPARGHDLLTTAGDPTGAKSLGTWNNCGSGRTPWGTCLSCEENFNGYFSASAEDFEPTDDMKRYGLGKKDWGYGWAKSDERFDLSKHPNEPNRAGYVIEIDPVDPGSKPKKRTALGRFKHENAELVIAKDGRVVVYQGDDERGEFLYRFVSDGKYTLGGNNGDLLDSGKLYVAKFSDDMSGEWLELSPETTNMGSFSEICIHTRQAASNVGATTMDRPEWVASNSQKNEVYCCLTNNINRGKKPNKGGDKTPAGGPNPRVANKYGQIVRWVPENGNHGADKFTWDLFVIAGNPLVHKDEYAGSKNITADNMFNSPDGIGFDENGLLYIQTDGNYSNTKDFAGMGNNQMLVGDPNTGEIRRFMVGPRQAEITSITWSADGKTLFVGIQHPENGDSHFPDGGNSVPRSAVIGITRDDGSKIG